LPNPSVEGLACLVKHPWAAVVQQQRRWGCGGLKLVAGVQHEEGKGGDRGGDGMRERLMGILVGGDWISYSSALMFMLHTIAIS